MDDTPQAEPEKEGGRIRIQGAWDIGHFRQAEKALKQACAKAGEAPVIDVSGVTRLDTAGAFLLSSGFAARKKAQSRPRLTHVMPEHKELFQLVGQAEVKPAPVPHKVPAVRKSVEAVGKSAVYLKDAAVEFISFTGQAFVELGRVAANPKRLRLLSVSNHIERIGIDALPIIALISVVMSIVIAYQGQVQLKPLGAQQYTVNLVAISVLREMAGLLTAIMIAGRSGSAFTAEIGTMKIRDEIDALKTIGIEPFNLLVTPRIVALLITLPLLTFFADFMGLLGGAMISQSLLDMSTLQYLEQVRHSATWKDFFVGMIKSPVFAMVIALVGCRHGLKVTGSSDSVGKETTASVVESIFLVLMLDGLFSIYFQKVGI